MRLLKLFMFFKSNLINQMTCLLIVESFFLLGTRRQNQQIICLPSIEQNGYSCTLDQYIADRYCRLTL